jgi:hypothetical protein
MRTPGTCAGAVAQLTHGLLQGEHAVHAGVRVGEPAAVRVQRQRAARCGVAIPDEPARLAAWHEAEILETVDRQVRERVVDHQVPHVARRDAGLGERHRARDAERARSREVLHLAHERRLDALAGAEHVDRPGREIARALGRHQHQRPAAVGDQAALE